MKRKLSFILLIMTAVVSCSRKDETVSAPVGNHSFSIIAELPGISTGDDVKGTLGSYVSASWTKGDKVSVVNLTTGMTLGGELTADKSGTTTTFSGSVSGTINVGNVLAIVYPSLEEENEVAFTSVTGHLDHQSYSSNVPLCACGYFVADKVNGSFSGFKVNFEYGLSFLKLNMANLPPSSTATAVTIRNIPNTVTFTINGAGDRFDISTTEEKASKNLIEVYGTFNISDEGTLMVPVAVVPSDAGTNRSVVVTVTGEGDFSAPLSSSELTNHRYYNTIVSDFVKTGLPGVTEYGAYNLLGTVLDDYSAYGKSIITGVESGNADFTMLKTSPVSYWTIKGIPAEVSEGDTFTAGFSSYGVTDFPTESIPRAKVVRIDKDGDYSKLWVVADGKSADYLFIIRK